MNYFICPECRELLRIPDNLLHTPGRCPKCQHKFTPVDTTPAFEGDESQQASVVRRSLTCSISDEITKNTDTVAQQETSNTILSRFLNWFYFHGQIDEKQINNLIRNAGIAACIPALITFKNCIDGITNVGGISLAPWINFLLSVILTIWILEGSRLAIVLILFWFITDKLASFWIFQPSIYNLAFLLLPIFYFQGVRAAFTKKRYSITIAPIKMASHRNPYLVIVVLMIYIFNLFPIPVLSLLRSKEALYNYPFHYAIAEGNLSKAKELLCSGYDINEDCYFGTPLEIAASIGTPKTVLYLINNGADPNLADWKGWKPIHATVFAEGANLETLVTLLENGADVNGRDYHLRTALHRAAQFGHEEAVKVLLYFGAQPDALDENGWTPLDRADKHPEIQAILLQNDLAYGAAKTRYNYDDIRPSENPWDMIAPPDDAK